MANEFEGMAAHSAEHSAAEHVEIVDEEKK